MLSFYSGCFEAPQYESLRTTVEAIPIAEYNSMVSQNLTHLMIHQGNVAAATGAPEILAACSFGVHLSPCGTYPKWVIIHLVATSSTNLTQASRFKASNGDGKPTTARGLATMLISYLDICFCQWYPSVRVMAGVSPDNKVATAFFKSNGFKEVDHTAVDYQKFCKWGTP